MLKEREKELIMRINNGVSAVNRLMKDSKI